MSQGQNSSNQREKNESVILSLIRCHQALSKADITRAIGLTYPAVARIVDDLEKQHLIKKEGTLKKTQGKPATLYEINNDGKFAIAVEVQDQTVYVVTVDFHGNPVSTYKHHIETETAKTLGNTIYSALLHSINSLTHQQRTQLKGIGLVECDNNACSMLEVKKCLLEKLKASENQQLNILSKLPLIISPRGIAAAAAEVLKNPTIISKNILSIFIGNNIDGCFVFSNKIYLQRPHGNNFLASMPISNNDVRAHLSAQSYSLNEVCSLGSLERDLIATNQWPIVYTDIAAHTIETRKVINAWIERASSGLAIAIEACASLHQLDEVVVDSAIPCAWLSAIIIKIKNKNTSIPGNNIRSGLMGENAALIGCAALIFIGNQPT